MTNLLSLLHIATPLWAADAVHKADSVPSWVVWLGGAVVLPFLWPKIKAWVAASIAGDFLKAVKTALDEGDEDDDILILAFVRWVKVKSTKLGAKGADAYAVIAKWICDRVKLLAGHETMVAELAEACVESVRDTAAIIEEDQKMMDLLARDTTIKRVQAIQAKIEAGGANENLTAATVLCSELIAALTPPVEK